MPRTEHQSEYPPDGPLDITRSYSASTWIKDDKHAFLTPSEERVIDPVSFILDLKSGIADLDETIDTFLLSDVLDEHDPRNVQPEYLLMARTWRVPERMSKGVNARRCVNPNSDATFHYSDAVVECQCGTVFAHGGAGHPRIDRSCEHADDCKPYHRKEAQAELMRRREQIVKTMLLTGVYNGSDAAARIGVEGGSLGAFTRDYNFSVYEYRRRGRQIMANTCGELLEYYTPRELAGVYDYSPNRITKYTRELADADTGDLYDQRTGADQRTDWTPDYL